jgi:hypothetical protein
VGIKAPGGNMRGSRMSDDDVELLPPAQRDGKGRLLPGQRSINPHGRPWNSASGSAPSGAAAKAEVERIVADFDRSE